MKKMGTSLLIVAVGTLLGQSAHAAVEGMISYWSLDELSGDVVHDSVGGSHGTIGNDPEWVTGILGGALRFDGVDDYVEVAENASLDLGAGDFSISFWVNFNPFPKYEVHALVVKRQQEPIYPGYSLFIIPGGELRGQLDCGYPWYEHTTVSASLVAGTWYHVVWSVDRAASMSYFYVNGNAIDSPDPIDTLTTSASTDNDAPLFMGAGLVTTSAKLDGIIDEVAIYGRALSAEEIAEHWNDGVDADDDGVPDIQDAFPNDPAESSDNDGDGTGDNADTDDDNDGVLDGSDAFPNDPGESTDSDGDGIGDNGDAFPGDPAEWADSDGDGAGDNTDAFPNDPTESTDSDGDGVGDNGDAFPDNPEEWADSDGDGVGDNTDAFPDDPTRWENVPPVVGQLDIQPIVLSPPNGKMVDVTVRVVVTDDGSGVDIVTLFVDDEYDELYVDIPLTMDLVSGDLYEFVVPLDASFAGGDRDGRSYRLWVSATDHDANVATSESQDVTVPVIPPKPPKPPKPEK